MCDFEVVEAEHHFEVPLCDLDTGELLTAKSLVGIFDLVTPHGIVELKTTKSVYDPSLFARHLQLSAYAYAYHYMQGKMPTLALVHLLKLKKPRVEITTLKRERKQLLFFLRTAQAVARGIEEEIFAPNPCWQCVGCEYGKACMEWPEIPLSNHETETVLSVHH